MKQLPILKTPHPFPLNDRNIATLARAYHGLPLGATWTPENGFTK